MLNEGDLEKEGFGVGTVGSLFEKGGEWSFAFGCDNHVLAKIDCVLRFHRRL